MFASCTHTFGQGAFGATALGDSAFANFHRGNYIDAIRLYKKVVAQDPYGFAMEQLALCYLKADSISQAKDMFEKTIRLNSKIPDAAYHASHELADLYYKEKDYKKAIDYIQLNSAIWEKARFPVVNTFSFNYQKAVDLSNCYNELKQPDSAIAVLTPYVFSNYLMLTHRISLDPEPIDSRDSLKHDSICRAYLSLLLQRHTAKNIKQELKNADAGFHYAEENQFYGADKSQVRRIAYLRFTFYGVHVDFETIWNDPFKYNVVTPQWYKKQQQEGSLRRFRLMPLYKMITAL